MDFIKTKIEQILSNKIVEFGILFLICLNLFVLILQTDKNYNKYSSVFYLVESVTVAIFSIEYIFRIILLDKITKIFKPLLLIDLLAILPFYIGFLCDNLLFLRIFRLFRFFRLFKLTRYSIAMQRIKNIFITKKEELIIIGSFFIISLLFFSIMMYFVEGNQQNFSTIPKTLWWTVITFTSVGYGDVTPVSPLGKFVASLTAILGIGLHGILISVLGAGFFEGVISQRED